MKLETFIKIVQPFTMTSEERIKSLFESLEYIRTNNIKGDIVECGVWKGGNILGVINYLNFYNEKRDVWLYDTFEGMTHAESIDIDLNNVSGKMWEGKCDASIDYVKSVLKTCPYSEDLIHYVKGDVCQTLLNKENIPSEISLLRLDTDWYKSTKSEMEILYPKLSEKGVLIIDDYGHWNGAKKAIDEYLENNKINKVLNKIDYTGVKFIK